MKRILTIDGGGSRGLFAIQILRKMESLLPLNPGTRAQHTLNSYFDLMAGTSTGAIIACLLRWGQSLDQIQEFYERRLHRIFFKLPGERIVKHVFDPEPLKKELQQIFGKPPGFKSDGEERAYWKPGEELPDCTLGSDKLQGYLMVVTLRAETLSPWPLTNHPKARYNDVKRHDCNLQIPLWQLVRASTAAPYYFPPQRIWLPHPDGQPKTEAGKSTLGKYNYFVDGGVSGYNNPAHLAYRMATLPEYPFQWETGAGKLKIISVGTGDFDSKANRPDPTRPFKVAALEDSQNTIRYLMALSALEQDMQCRIIGQTLAGHEIDRELGTLQGPDPQGRRDRFTYCRYQKQFDNQELIAFRKKKIGYEFTDTNQNTQKMFIAEGEAYAATAVKEEHLT